MDKNKSVLVQVFPNQDDIKMESDGSHQVKEEDKPPKRSSFMGDFVVSSSSSSDEDERPCLASCRVKEPSSNIKANTPQNSDNKLDFSSWTKELHDSQIKIEDQKPLNQSKEIQNTKLMDLLDYSSGTSETDQEDPRGCTTAATSSPRPKENPFSSKPWTAKDIIYLLQRMRKQLPKVDSKGCLHTAKKINWENIAFDCFTAGDCKKEFEVLLSNIKLMKTMTAVISELEEKIPSGKLKAFLILQPRQQFVRDFAEKNKGLVSGIELFSASADAWKKLTPEEKENYNREYILAKEKEIATMNADEPPVRPKIPFELYYEELCKKKGQKNLELKAMARERYKTLDPKKKMKFIALSAIELHTYELQVAKYLQKQPDWNVPVQRGPSKEDSEMYLKSLGMPPRPPYTASLLYYHQKLKAGEYDNIHGTTRLFHAIEQFRKLSEHKKRKYRQKHKEMLQEYTMEYESWWEKQNEVVRRLADKLLGKKQVLPSGTLYRLQEHSREREIVGNEHRRFDRKDIQRHEGEKPCCRHQKENEPDEQLSDLSRDKNLPSPDMQKLRQICKQEVFFNIEQPLEAKMEKIMLMVSGYEYLPNKTRQKFDNAFKKWKYSFQASIIVDLRCLDKYERDEFLFKYRPVCKSFFKRDIFQTVFPADTTKSKSR